MDFYNLYNFKKFTAINYKIFWKYTSFLAKININYIYPAREARRNFFRVLTNISHRYISRHPTNICASRGRFSRHPRKI